MRRRSAEPMPTGGHELHYPVMGFSRRSFLRQAGVAGGIALTLGACAGGGDDPRRAGDPGDTTAETLVASRLVEDLQFACTATALENLAVATYQAGIDAADAGRLGNVPAAVLTFATTAMRQHQDHADAFNAILTGGGRPQVTAPDFAVKPEFDKAFSMVRDVPGLARMALNLENLAAATYLSGVGVLQNEKVLQTTMSIQPVELQHAAFLGFLLGQYPVPDAFARVDGARPATDCPAP